MSNDDYVTHIIQKYRLAISIAIIRSKPEDTTLERYIQQLRSKILEERMDTDDLNISICSDDFVIDNTNGFSLNISNNDEIAQFDRENHEKIEINRADIMNTQDLVNRTINIYDINSSKVRSHESNGKFEEMYHRNEENDVEMIDTQDLNNSITILQNFEVGNVDFNKNDTQRRSFEDAMNILKSIDGNMTIIEKGFSKKKSTNEIKSLTNQPLHINQHHTDNDATLCQTADILSNVEDHNHSQELNFNYNHISDCKNGQTVNNTHSKSRLSYRESNRNTQSDEYKTDEAELNTITSKTQSKSGVKQDEINVENRFKTMESKAQSSVREYRHTKEFKNIYHNVADIFNTKKNNNINEDENISNPTKLMSTDKLKDIPQISQDFITHTIPDDSTCKTQYSESQIDDLIIIEDKYIHGTNKNNNKQKKEEKTDSDSVITKGTHTSNDVFSQPIQKTDLSVLPMNSSQNDDTYMTIYNNQDNSDNGKYTKGNTNRIDNFDNDIFTQESQLTNVSSDLTKYSQKFDNINHNNKETEGTFQIYGSKKDKTQAKSKVRFVDSDLFSQESHLTNFSTILTNSSQNITEKSAEVLQDAQNLDEYFNRFGTVKTQNAKASNENFRDMYINKTCTGFEENFKNTLGNGSSTEFDENSQNLQVIKVKTTEHNHNATAKLIQDSKNCTNFDKNLDKKQDLNPPIELNKKVTKLINFEKPENEVTDNRPNFDESENMEVEEEWTDSQIELIPFKVIEELNKVKMYLNKRNEKKVSTEGCSSDAGYRSDSQSKSSFMSQSASSWLDQSAHSIFNYITDCALVETTQDITNEISVVLGLFIDKLHEEEMYPSFLEELLDTVQLMLRAVNEDHSGETVLMDKDDTTQRILLLNKSTHIQRFTIEKITYMLENLHTELTKKDKIYEIENIDRIENICYIFHILEIILQRHKKTSQNLSQSTQNSQERVLKKSNIQDIWRKKWNPNYKETQNEGSSEKKCVIVACCAILNKLIVDCMEGYSLVSFVALKCFNVMQT